MFGNLLSLGRFRFQRSLIYFSIFTLAFASTAGARTSETLGDLDQDQLVTVRDLALLVGFLKEAGQLTDAQKILADADDDGSISQADVDHLVKVLLGVNEEVAVAPLRIRSASPSPGESGVSLTRETVVHFSIPLSLDATLENDDFLAELGGRKVLSRAELSGDRKKATLFYLEPLPSSARIRVQLKGDRLTDLLGRPADLDGDGEPGGHYEMSFDTLSIMANPTTGMVGRVLASERKKSALGGVVDVPLAGVTITVDGAEETMRAVTDTEGNFTLSPCPVGNFFVKIDGRTSGASNYPAGAYYPVVGKEWSARVGDRNNLAGGTGTIFLPRIGAGTLQMVSTTTSTDIALPASVLEEFPEFAGTELIVPANSLYSDDGSRGGQVGLAPVSPDRLPEPLPPGLGFPFVITIQTDGGANFDQPAPLCLPNLPDPETGNLLGPGERSALWSFDHDTGRWEIAGSMTVTADGKFVKTDPGVGVREPGWHGTQPGSEGCGGAPVSPGVTPADINIHTAYVGLFECLCKLRRMKALFSDVEAFNELSLLTAKEIQSILSQLSDDQLTVADFQTFSGQVATRVDYWEGLFEVLGAGNDDDVLKSIQSVIECLTTSLDLLDAICKGKI
ncbi:MAG: dockerin type I domain-containing protein [Verrucomicrobiota bacterium]